MTAFIVGSSGLVGNYILKHAPEYYSNVVSLSRSKPDNSENDQITTILEKNSDEWTKQIDNFQLKEDNTAFFSGLGTTKAAAGGIENQRLIDYDLNLNLAKAAKAKGFKKYILISSYGASKDSKFPYLKMKGELEDAVKDLGFESTIILQPGVLLGDRKISKGFGNNLMVSLTSWSTGTPFSKYLFNPIHGEDVAKAALKLAQKETSEKVVVVGGSELYDIARS
ncbi:hypothetical protein BN7_3386 [Wickerhamomyces ciferrii]|uniref:Protein FMP52, mitochondrial n=1 Tax=Wickerhamomyces ciferrii (strain ATCC 14091 / BCRC 22168 / CBS 111 / JCM 3599 / NBRC 0793 / NRRL Y-1031 F-60-10) TaxID=1206466 RepID=K0KNT6_WICCF|nr:uncharacterized protein BN7_3386 [Wickerhamomyces ciferrii]CCH43832.1 hypothetical protein BN7_3386 [Wickerhamomyces ciferrii]